MNSPESSTTPTRLAMTVGAVVGLLMLAVPMVLSIVPSLAQVSGMVVFIVGIYYAGKQYRRVYSEQVNFAKVFSVGMQTAFYASIIVAFVIYILLKLNPEELDKYLTIAEQMVQSRGWPSEITSKSIEQMKQVLSPGLVAFSAIMLYNIFGAIIACICAFFLKDNPSNNHLSDSN